MSVSEFPGLQIDDFRQHADRPTPVLCLLTHMHADHLLGLERQSYYGPLVYCSAATRAMVLNIRGSNGDGDLKYHHLRKDSCGIEILQSLEFDVAHRIPYGPRKHLQVTLIHANHCPGAAMFLVQSESQAILFTGDTRCERWHVDALAHHPSLLPFTFGDRSLALYMDNSFEQHAKRELSYDGNFKGISHVVNMICERPYRPNTTFAALFTTTGYEEVLVALAHKMQTKVHMDTYYYSLYLAAADFCPLAKHLVELCAADPLECRLHWCRKGCCTERDKQTTVFFSPCVTIVPEAVAERNASLRLDDFNVKGQCDQPVFCHYETGARYVLGSDGDTLLPGHMLFRFSRHASLPELQRLAALFPTASVKSAIGKPLYGFKEPEQTSFQASPIILNATPRKPKQAPKETPEPPAHQSNGALPLYKKQMAKPRQPAPRRKRELKRRSFTSSSSDDHHDVLAFLNQQVSKHKPEGPEVSPKRESARRESAGCESAGYKSAGHESAGHESAGREPTGPQSLTPPVTPKKLKLAMPEPTIIDSVTPDLQGSLASPPTSPAPVEEPTKVSLLAELSELNRDPEDHKLDGSAHLEQELRQNLASWFDLKFDWAKPM